MNNTVNKELIMTQAALPDEFRQSMRRHATTVAIITARNGDAYTGMAATAVMSVTAEPPTIMVAVKRTASLSPILTEAGWFCVNLLSHRHQSLVGIFSGQKKGAERFETGDWIIDTDRPPILADAVASLVCRTSSTFEIATHTLFAGEVKDVVNHPTIDPLIWVDGGFGPRLFAE